MERIMKKPELTDELAKRTGFYKKKMKEVVDALFAKVVEYARQKGMNEIIISLSDSEDNNRSGIT